jgi:hypothetical protein
MSETRKPIGCMNLDWEICDTCKHGIETGGCREFSFDQLEFDLESENIYCWHWEKSDVVLAETNENGVTFFPLK